MENRPPADERRQATDRRSALRDGKYDRRKNTCGMCRYYRPQDTQQGACLKHETTVAFHDSSCVLFALKTTPTLS